MTTYKRILNYVFRYKKSLLASMIFTILFSLMSGASVYLSIPMLETLFQEKDTQTTQIAETVEKSSSFIPEIISEFLNEIKTSFNEFVFTGGEQQILLKIVFLILIAFLLKNIFGYLQAYFLAFVEQSVIRDFRNEIFNHLHTLPMSFFKGERTGNIISRITSDTLIIQQSVSAVFLNLIREPLTIIVFLGIAVSISVELTLFSFIVLPFSLAIIAYIGKILRKQSTLLQGKMADITSVIHETITGIKVVKAFGMEEFEAKKFMDKTHGYFKLILRMVRIRNIASPTTEFLSVIVGGAIIYYGGRLVLVNHTLAASEFLGFLFAIFQIMQPVKALTTVNNKIQEASAAADRVFDFIDIEPEIKEIENPKPIKNFKDKIEFKNVSFQYEENDSPVLKNINLEINKSEIVAFVGSSGSGKTTLVDLIPRFFDVNEGEILIDGINIKEYKIDDLKKLIGIVTQETILFNDTIKNNIAYGQNEVPLEKINRVAQIANAQEFIANLPDNFETEIGEKGTRLSGGQRQRLSIARALYKNPPIMIFDEATSALDNESEVLVQQAIEKLMKDRTVVVIAHRLSTIRNANKIIVMDSGEIVQVGTHEELINIEDGIYRKLYDLQFSSNENS